LSRIFSSRTLPPSSSTNLPNSSKHAWRASLAILTRSLLVVCPMGSWVVGTVPPKRWMTSATGDQVSVESLPSRKS